MLFVAMCFVLLGLGIAYSSRFERRRRKLKAFSWEEIFIQLQSLDVTSLQRIADCYLEPNERQLRIEPGTMWEVVGGIDGIRKLRANSDIMLQLAIYAERWNDVNGRVISEIMRRDGLRIKAAVSQIESALITQRGLVYIGMDLQEAIAFYCLMRRRLLGMYGECHVGLLQRLLAAV